MQDVFIKAYRNLYGFDVRRKFSPWIYRIAHNEALNYLKKHSHELIDLDDEELEIIDEKADIKEDLDSVIFKEKIEKALAALSDKYREPFILYFFEERSYEEISDILRIPRSTVGVLIMRAKKNLKEYFSQK